RDLRTVEKLARPRGGSVMAGFPPGAEGSPERELNWDDVARELDAGGPLSCYRMCVGTAVVVGAQEGGGGLGGPFVAQGTWARLAGEIAGQGERGAGGNA